jgi:aldehyde:ferredoxin oxidoreductase
MLNRDYIKVVYIDLTTRRVKIERRQDLMEYIGGSGVATKLFSELVKIDKDPLDPDQPIIFSVGPMNTIFPIVTKTSAVFRSPLTGNFGESHAGGRLAMAMRFAGYDAVVIQGRASSPVYLAITQGSIDIKDAGFLWGEKVERTGKVLRDREAKIGSGKRSIIRIGQAGERLVRFASVNVDTYRHFGRLGLGAVFGSKLLKAIVVGGNRSYPIPKPKEYNSVYEKILKIATESDAMKKYHELGTPVNVVPLSTAGGLPTRNLTATSFESAQEIDGVTFAEEILLRKISCSGCPIGCIHIALLRQEFGPGYETTFAGVGYDYELIFALGSMIGVGKKSDLLSLIDAVEEYGLDAMSTGVILAWITEAFQRGIVTREMLKTDVSFGDAAAYLNIISYIVTRPNEFYRDLGMGLSYVSEKYGGKDFAMVLGGHEMTGYHTGYGSMMGQAVSTRHSHLDNAGYAIDQGMKEFDKEELVKKLIAEEIDRNMLTSLHICLFARKIYGDKALVSEALSSIGIEKTPGELTAIGEKIWRLKNRLKKDMGFDFSHLTFPKRFFETTSMNGKLDEKTAHDILNLYIEKAGLFEEEPQPKADEIRHDTRV